MDGYVYFIRQKNENLFKIGMTQGDPCIRLKSMQTGIPYELELFSVITTNNPSKLERELHNLFSEYHVRGEWFNLTPEQVEDYMKQSDSPIDSDVVEIKQASKKFYYQKSTGKVFMDTHSVDKIMGSLYLASCFVSNRAILGFKDGTMGIDLDLIIEDFGAKEELINHKQSLIECAKNFNG